MCVHVCMYVCVCAFLCIVHALYIVCVSVFLNSAYFDDRAEMYSEKEKERKERRRL